MPMIHTLYNQNRFLMFEAKVLQSSDVTVLIFTSTNFKWTLASKLETIYFLRIYIMKQLINLYLYRDIKSSKAFIVVSSCINDKSNSNTT